MTPATAGDDRLPRLIAAELSRPCPGAVTALARALREKHGACVKAVLAYGSCLRGVDPAEGITDLYLLVSSERAFHRSGLAAALGRRLPPDVYFHQCHYDGRPVRAKYAVVSLDNFEARMGANIGNPYFWARFAQPAVLLHADGEETRARIIAALARAVRTALANAVSLAGAGREPETLWETLFRETYRTELRSEGTERAGELIRANPDYYRAAAAAVLGGDGAPAALAGGRADAAGLWRRRRLWGKTLSLARLAKAAFTFQGGIDYVAWKIARHSGVAFTPSPWQRRHPILAALVLLPRLYLRGGFR